MKNSFKSLVAATAGLLLLAASASATEITAWSQLGFTIELSSGTLNIAPGGTFNDAGASWQNAAIPFAGAAAASALDGYAYASTGSSTAISLSLNADNFFLVDAFAQTEAILNVSGSAAATALALYDLSFTGVIGSSVTLTLTPQFYNNTITLAGGSFSYASAFLSLGSEIFYSSVDSNSNAGYAAFAPITLTVGAGETVQLSAVVSAGTSVPEAGSTLLLASLALFGLVGVRRQLVHARVAV